MLKDKVERINATSRVSPVRNLHQFDNLLNRQKSKDRRLNVPRKKQENSKGNTCSLAENHINCTI
jgi:hypothetical protein